MESGLAVEPVVGLKRQVEPSHRRGGMPLGSVVWSRNPVCLAPSCFLQSEVSLTPVLPVFSLHTIIVWHEICCTCVWRFARTVASLMLLGGSG